MKQEGTKLGSVTELEAAAIIPASDCPALHPRPNLSYSTATRALSLSKRRLLRLTYREIRKPGLAGHRRGERQKSQVCDQPLEDFLQGETISVGSCLDGTASARWCQPKQRHQFLPRRAAGAEMYASFIVLHSCGNGSHLHVEARLATCVTSCSCGCGTGARQEL